jgi:hypothetical protein
VVYTATLTAELRDEAESTADSVRRLVEQLGGTATIAGTVLTAHPGPDAFAGERLMRHLQKDPLVVPESVGWS